MFVLKKYWLTKAPQKHPKSQKVQKCSFIPNFVQFLVQYIVYMVDKSFVSKMLLKMATKGQKFRTCSIFHKIHPISDIIVFWKIHQVQHETN